MATLTVDPTTRRLCAFERIMPCIVGRGGACAASDKREGDGRTPIGRWPIRGVLLRPGRIVLDRVPAISWRWLRPTDGWSDDSRDPDYNRPVFHPHRFGAERLWRADAAYDVVVVLGHNDDPPRAGLGSAVFLHLTAASPVTDGCIALERRDLTWLLGRLRAGDDVDVRPDGR